MRKKEAKKRASGAQCVLEAILSAKSEATGSADYGQTLRNIKVFTLGGFRRHESQKSRFGLLKITLWAPFWQLCTHLRGFLAASAPRSAYTKAT